MGKFEDEFSEVQYFTNNTMAIRGDMDRETAVQEFERYTGENVDENKLTTDYVRFCFSGFDIADYYDFDGPCWTTGANPNKPGSKKVWLYDPLKD